MLHIFKGNMRVMLRAAEEDRRLAKINFWPGRFQRTDQRAAETGDESVAPRIASRVFQGQAATLGKTSEPDAFGRNSSGDRLRNKLIDDVQ